MLKRRFFERDPLSCARELIGYTLKWGALSGIVVETEAYDVDGDEACHTAFRPSAKAFVTSHRAGAAYVYFNYGVHWMLNVLVKGKRLGFVLIRALEPIKGIEQMKKARGTRDPLKLCSGPGKLTMALGVTGGHHGKDLCVDPAFSFSTGRTSQKIEISPRVGISRAAELPWRFYAAGNPHVSHSYFVKIGRDGNPARPRN
jgi:DNA-3-methyladenine glycosylase